jgi:AmmeMemoRadiSam system protein B
MKISITTFFCLALACAVACCACAYQCKEVQAPQSEAVYVEKKVRQPVDNVGYTHSADGIAKVVEHMQALERDELLAVRDKYGFNEQTAFQAAISPHDDYIYAGRVYTHVYPYIKAKHVILIGVAHKARDFPEVEGKLVFDNFDAWHGPYGDVAISPLREELLANLSKDDAIVNDELQTVEHSVEGLVPFLQHFNRDVQIVPVLVPYMSWERLDELAQKTAQALAKAMSAQSLEFAEDVAILISSDSVHYGDQEWGGKNFDDFGVDKDGYDKAVERDLSLIDEHLVGGISLSSLESFYHKLVQDDFHEYRITWCGRFSIPFGLALLIDLNEQLGREVPKGLLLRYATTLDPGASDPGGVPGLGVTAPADLHHWVGFTAIGYR